jgi:hypothetical protein
LPEASAIKSAEASAATAEISTLRETRRSRRLQRLSLFVFCVFYFHQDVQILANVLLLGFSVDFIGGVLSVPDYFGLLSFGTHLYLLGKK